ncbi:MAG: site-specific integrase [Filimonas sp.]|nr:site-specific integrase [Filimonas sp.]
MARLHNAKVGSVYPFLDTRFPNQKTALYPVKLTINLKGSQFRIALKLYSSKEVFQKSLSNHGSIPKEAKILKTAVKEYMDRAENILNQFPNIDQKMFTNLFKSDAELKVSGKTDMSVLFQKKIEELKSEDRAGSMAFYEGALRTFKTFTKHFYLEDITAEWLNRFSAYWMNKGNSKATCQIHLRSLRHIYNRAIKDGYIAAGHYPFKDYTIGTSSKSKEVLYPEQLKALWEYKPRTYGEERSKDYFFFLYLCNGVNIKDALSFKWSNVKGDMLSFNRAKTIRTKMDAKEIVIYFHPEARRIVQKWGNMDKKGYLFPCFNDTTSDMERKSKKDIFARNLNRDMRPIGKALKLPFHLTLELARHSYATKLKLDGTPTSFISDAMGHSNSKTTEHYMKTLPDSSYKVISDNLLRF